MKASSAPAHLPGYKILSRQDAFAAFPLLAASHSDFLED